MDTFVCVRTYCIDDPWMKVIGMSNKQIMSPRKMCLMLLVLLLPCHFNTFNQCIRVRSANSMYRYFEPGIPKPNPNPNPKPNPNLRSGTSNYRDLANAYMWRINV